VVLLATLVLIGALPIAILLQLWMAPAPDMNDPGAVAFLGGLVAISTISAVVGAMIVWRRPDNVVGALLLIGAVLLASDAAAWWILVVAGLSGTGTLQSALIWWAIVSVLPAVFVLFPSVGLFFPDGRLPGPRWRAPYIAAVTALIVGLVLQTVSPSRPDAAGDVMRSPFSIPDVPPAIGDVGAVLTVVAVLGAFVLAVGSVTVRYRRSAGVERAQVKWLVAAVVVNSITFPVSYLVDVGLLDLVGVAAGCLIPISVGIAVTRYRLYDIDRLISRTLSWAIVTGGVVTIFVLLVVGLQGALEGLTQGETVAVALSTIVAAALFQPARRRVQQAVDRRFDRGRYDADRTAAAFAEQLRDEVDLSRLAGDVLGVVDVALRPTSRALWLRTNGIPLQAGGSAVTIPGHSVPKVTPT
jgi:hypothetical protein